MTHMPPKRVLMIAPEFPPCNLTAGHRARLFVRHLSDFGYEPTVLTVRSDRHESPIDLELMQLVAPNVSILRTDAFGTRPIRIVGDIGLRSFLQMFLCIRKLCRTQPPDLLYISIPPNYSSLLGPLIQGLFRIPFIIDYIDPWVYPPLPAERASWKAMASHRLARLLEPIVARRADGITSVSAAYFADVLERYPELKQRPSTGIPYGGEPLDHAYAAQSDRRSTLLNDSRLVGKTVFVYAGAILPTAIGTLTNLLLAFQTWVNSGNSTADNCRLLFVGTGSSPNDSHSGIVGPIAQQLGIASHVVEIADRQPYLEVLRTLHQAHAVMILGSSEAFYTASKTFQALHSQRPILGLLHQDSSATQILRDAAGTFLVTYGGTTTVEDCKETIMQQLKAAADCPPTSVGRDVTLLERYSAREMTRQLALFFEEVLQNQSAPKESR